MRKRIEEQPEVDAIPISEVPIDVKSRDEMPKLFIGLKYIHANTQLREAIFDILDECIPDAVDRKNGRPGLSLWSILVLGCVRLICNWNYDTLKDSADNHRTLRYMLGLGRYDTETTFPLQTLRDNVSLLTPDVLDSINEKVVATGHEIMKKKTNGQYYMVNTTRLS